MSGRKMDPRYCNDAVRARMSLVLFERKASKEETRDWLKGRLTTLRIRDFAEKYPVSYDWLLGGDLKGLLCMARGFPHGESLIRSRPDLSA